MVTPFLINTSKMLNETRSSCIQWSSDGSKIVINDRPVFVSSVLPRFFRHSNFETFRRQLLYYQFIRDVSVAEGPLIYSHLCFHRDMPHLLPMVKRKKVSNCKNPQQEDNNNKFPPHILRERQRDQKRKQRQRKRRYRRRVRKQPKEKEEKHDVMIRNEPWEEEWGWEWESIFDNL
eukprot:GILJ01023968.1.p1 GENE.GILJ01023968.1~~GILJ01023968.1.p1  ORF type:complete len:176 (-),score=17.74 GILJ01023968.1:114-641(-)